MECDYVLGFVSSDGWWFCNFSLKYFMHMFSINSHRCLPWLLRTVYFWKKAELRKTEICSRLPRFFFLIVTFLNRMERIGWHSCLLLWCFNFRWATRSCDSWNHSECFSSNGGRVHGCCVRVVEYSTPDSNSWDMLSSRGDTRADTLHCESRRFSCCVREESWQHWGDCCHSIIDRA